MEISSQERHAQAAPGHPAARGIRAAGTCVAWLRRCASRRQSKQAPPGAACWLTCATTASPHSWPACRRPTTCGKQDKVPPLPRSCAFVAPPELANRPPCARPRRSCAAHDVVRLVQQQLGGRAPEALIGHSMGGKTALEVVRQLALPGAPVGQPKQVGFMPVPWCLLAARSLILGVGN